MTEIIEATRLDYYIFFCGNTNIRQILHSVCYH